MFVKIHTVCPCKPFQPILILVRMAGAYPSGAPKETFPLG